MISAMTVPPPTKSGWTLTPQERAIEKKRTYWREVMSSEKIKLGDFDPDTFDWSKYGEHFDNLSEDEWAAVRKNILIASGQASLANEGLIRELVDDAAQCSGWFAEIGDELHISGADYRRFAAQDRRFLGKVQKFRQEVIEFFGEPPDDHKELYDPWGVYRPMIGVLAHLSARLRRDIAEDEHHASVVGDAPNAAQPTLDVWRARLVLVWQNECRLPVENSKQLRGFLLDALRPYMLKAELTDRMGKHFISRWLAGKVQNPGMSLLRRLKDK